MKMFGELQDDIRPHILTFIITLVLNTLVFPFVALIDTFRFCPMAALNRAHAMDMDSLYGFMILD